MVGWWWQGKEGEGSRWRRGEEARGHSPSERAALLVLRCKDDGSPARRGWTVRSDVAGFLSRRISAFFMAGLVSCFRSGKAFGYELHDGDWIMGNQL